jgi:uncharacterized protein
MGPFDHAEPAGSDAQPETGKVVGSVAELWRYPVKSMRGGTVSQLFVTDRGSLGDRAWALRDPTNGRIASAKRFPQLLEFRATYEVEPTMTTPGRVRIEASDGQTVYADEPRASKLISKVLGRRLRLENQPRGDEKTGIDWRTVFGDVPVSEMKPDWTPEAMPDYFQLKTGTFFEIGAVYLLGSGSVGHLRELQGGTALIDRRRFRPNIYIDTGPAMDQFVEDEWIGGTLKVGGSVVLDEFQPTLWCVTSTLAQEELPRDRTVLRTAAQYHSGCLGVCASVRHLGLVRVGHQVVLHGPGVAQPPSRISGRAVRRRRS